MTMSDRRFGFTRRTLLQAVAAAPATLALPAAWAADQIAGSVSELTGEASAELNKESRKLKISSAVYLGDTLATGAQSKLAALLGRKTSLRLGPQTKVTIDAFIVNRGGEIALVSGAVLLDTGAGKFPKGLAVQSPFALIAVRGTRFFAGDIEGTFAVFAARGMVYVTAGGQTVRLKAGEGTDIAHTGDAPEPAHKWGALKIAKAIALVS
jgi:ferric-dicitrate binding protein FerR (iron transport regulator)